MQTERNRSRALGVCAGIVLLLTLAALGMLGDNPKTENRGRPTKDYDAPYFEAARRTLEDLSQRPGSRTSAMREMIMRNAPAAMGIFAATLRDPSEEVRKSAAEWLAHAKDKRGLDWHAACLTDPKCLYLRHHSVRLLGIGASPEYALLVAEQVRAAWSRGRTDKGVWSEATAEDRALVMYGVIALARMGRREDWDLIIDLVRARPPQAAMFLDALGYVEDPRSKDVLWSAYKEMLRPPKCDEPGLGVPALLQLARLNEPFAIERMKEILKGVGTPNEIVIPGRIPQPCSDRSAAFNYLRSRDARKFAQTVFEVAAQQPEGPATHAAWVAMGVMHPEGFGQRVLKLAVSKKPHWDFVSRDLLNRVVITIEPDLNEAFWSEFDLEVVPEMRGEKALVKAGLGRMMFEGSFSWTSD